jgi:hypothetical protein
MINATWIGWNQSVSLNVKLMIKTVFGIKLIGCTEKNQNVKKQIQHATNDGLLKKMIKRMIKKRNKKRVNLIKKMIYI